MKNPAYWLNGKPVTADQAMIPLDDHGLLYGDGVFEGIRFYQGQAFRLGAHLDRLALSARALLIPLPWSHRELETAVTEVIQASGLEAGYIRLVLTRGCGNLGLDPGHCHQPNLFLIADQVTLVAEEKRRRGLDLITASTRRPGPTVLDPRIKSLNYLNNILAKQEARLAGADEALLLNPQGYVVEGTAENVFVIRDECLQTPPVSDGALDGITRGIMLEISEQLGLPVHTCSLTPYDVYTAEECFLCGTGAELLPVRSLDGRRLDHSPGPITGQLQQAFEALIQQESAFGQ
jgi:branched-chain amino acid aminotransferase